MYFSTSWIQNFRDWTGVSYGLTNSKHYETSEKLNRESGTSILALLKNLPSIDEMMYITCTTQHTETWKML
jgi:hypothetical protein